MFNNKVILKKPLFMNEEVEDKITGAEKGTIVHLIMELLDFNKINTIDEIKDQINTFIKKKIITERQSTVINPYSIYKFFKSNIGQRMLKSNFVKREQAIYAQIKLKDVYLYEDLIEEDSLNYNDESIMLRGIIDAYFEEDEKIVIVDYKTDFVNDENKDEVINRYKKQLDLYSDVMKNLTGKEVKEKYIYLFGIDEGVSI
jgi:ATP-dependent helicase/nuclease subunit A